MGRAEKRMAKKREANGPQYQGGRPLTLNTNRNDRVPRNTVLSRLREVPVFGIRVLEGSNAPKTEGGFLVPAASDGLVSTFYMDPREAERVVQGTGAARELRVVGITLDEIVFDTSVRLQPAESAVNEGLTIPKDRALVTVIATPLFCIDGLQTTDKDTQVSSLPLFFSRADLLQFANPVYGASEAAKKVLITDLQVVVENMLEGPAGLLRNAKFFADAKALDWMDQQTRTSSASLFPTQGTLDGQRQQGLFGNLRMPWER